MEDDILADFFILYLKGKKKFKKEIVAKFVQK